MALEKFTFLDQVGIQKLSECILNKSNSRISERIVQELNDTSDANHVVSAALLNSLLKTRDAQIAANTTGVVTNKTDIDKVAGDIESLTTKVTENTTSATTVAAGITALDEKISGLTHLTIDTVIGSINDVADPRTDVLYLQKDDENDVTWMMYIYRDDKTWASIGDTGVDLSNYWSKDDGAEIKESLSVPEVTPLTEDKVLSAIDKAFASTKLYSLKIVGGDSKCTPNGIYAAGTLVTISCDVQKEGYKLEWIASGVALENVNATSTTFAMPANDVTITVSYKKATFHVTVSNAYMENGTGAGEYLPGATVTVHAKISAETDKATMFYKWKTVSGGVTVVNDEDAFPNPTGSFIMPESDVEVSAVYEEEIVHKLTVVGTESNDGEYMLHLNEHKNVYHGSKPGYSFKTWTTTSGQWYSLNSEEDTTFEMGEEDAVLTAVWDELITVNANGSINPTDKLRAMTADTPVDLVMPNNAKYITTQAFSNLPALRSVVISEGFTNLSNGAFSDCTSLASVTLPSTLTTIEPDSFYNTALTSINIPNNVASVAKSAFEKCTKLATINVNAVKDSIADAPWGAPNATVNWAKYKVFDPGSTSADGTISGYGEYKPGDTVTLVATSPEIPKQYFTFGGWSVREGNLTITPEMKRSQTITFPMPEENIAIKAIFNQQAI